MLRVVEVARDDNVIRRKTELGRRAVQIDRRTFARAGNDVRNAMLAAGGAGMTGGLWLVSGVGGALGLVGGAGGRGMYELGVNQLRIEVVKLQVSYKFMLLDQQIDTAKAQRIMASLGERIEELKQRIEIENAINDENSDRVSDLEEKLTLLLSGHEWMEEQELAA